MQGPAFSPTEQEAAATAVTTVLSDLERPLLLGETEETHARSLAHALAIVRYIEILTELGAAPPAVGLYGFAEVHAPYASAHFAPVAEPQAELQAAASTEGRAASLTSRSPPLAHAPLPSIARQIPRIRTRPQVCSLKDTLIKAVCVHEIVGLVLRSRRRICWR